MTQAVCPDVRTIIEIGPGTGNLTQHLLCHFPETTLITIEKDVRCQNVLKDLAKTVEKDFSVILSDALDVDFLSLGEPPRVLIGNLPFYVSVPITLKALKNVHAFSQLILMFQKEVADRFVAPVGCSAYGRLSVMAQWRCSRIQKLMNVPARYFRPVPKVDSAVLSFFPGPSPLNEPTWEMMECLVMHAFGQRRKMLRNALANLAASLPMADSALWLERHGIDPNIRAQNLSASQFVELARDLTASALF